MESREIIRLAVDAASHDPSFIRAFHRHRVVLVVSDNVLKQTLPGLGDKDRDSLINSLSQWARSTKLKTGFVRYSPIGYIEIVSHDSTELKSTQSKAMKIIKDFAGSVEAADILGIDRATNITEGFRGLDEAREATASFQDEINRTKQQYMSNLQNIIGEEGIDVRAAFDAATTVTKFAGSLSISFVPIAADKVNRVAMLRLREALADELVQKSHEMLKGQRKAALDNISSKIVLRRKFRPVRQKVKYTQFLEPKPGSVKAIGPDKTSHQEQTSLLSLTNLINDNLHDYVKARMGKGNATQILNYQTGRFARSAELLNLVRGQDNHLTATVTYMRSPYDVFRPGGHLFKPGRDPKRIIGQAMRDMVKEQFLKNQAVSLSVILG